MWRESCMGAIPALGAPTLHPIPRMKNIYLPATMSPTGIAYTLDEFTKLTFWM